MSNETNTARICAWFAMCANPAVGTVAHPILGDVPTCERCATRSGRPLHPIDLDRLDLP